MHESGSHGWMNCNQEWEVEDYWECVACVVFFKKNVIKRGCNYE